MLRHIKPGMLVFSVLYILLGLLLLLAPQAVADVFCIALGLLVVLCGLQSLYGYFKKDNGSIRAAVSLLAQPAHHCAGHVGTIVYRTKRHDL